MKIRKIFDAITYIIVYRVIAIAGIIFMIGIIIHSSIHFKHDATKLFVIFLATLGLGVIVSFLLVTNSFNQKEEEEQNNSFSKRGQD